MARAVDMIANQPLGMQLAAEIRVPSDYAFRNLPSISDGEQQYIDAVFGDMEVQTHNQIMYWHYYNLPAHGNIMEHAKEAMTLQFRCEVILDWLRVNYNTENCVLPPGHKATDLPTIFTNLMWEDHFVWKVREYTLEGKDMKEILEHVTNHLALHYDIYYKSEHRDLVNEWWAKGMRIRHIMDLVIGEINSVAFIDLKFGIIRSTREYVDTIKDFMKVVKDHSDVLAVIGVENENEDISVAVDKYTEYLWSKMTKKRLRKSTQESPTKKARL